MKTKRIGKTLIFKKETIANLKDLDRIKGGAIRSVPVFICPTLPTGEICYTIYPNYCPETEYPPNCPASEHPLCPTVYCRTA
jgi:hypothetical protein